MDCEERGDDDGMMTSAVPAANKQTALPQALHWPSPLHANLSCQERSAIIQALRMFRWRDEKGHVNPLFMRPPMTTSAFQSPKKKVEKK
jgi:hypothetical protein